MLGLKLIVVRKRRRLDHKYDIELACFHSACQQIDWIPLPFPRMLYDTVN